MYTIMSIILRIVLVANVSEFIQSKECSCLEFFKYVSSIHLRCLFALIPLILFYIFVTLLSSVPLQFIDISPHLKSQGGSFQHWFDSI